VSRTPTILLIVVAGFIAAWGCGQSPSSGRSLEARVAKLEQELKASEAARDSARAQAVAAEQKLKQEQARATTVEKELRNTLQARTAERDQALAQFEGFRKNLKDLLGQVEAAANTLPATTQPTSASTVAVPKGF
jgi:chromosome segregation ATPase